MNRDSDQPDRPPVEHGDNRKVTKPKTWATGRPAVVSSMKHILKAAGPVRGNLALAKLNQSTGFDCPSCAWPDPDDERSAFEFCENGAKAVASEVMSRTIGREFFSEFSVRALAARSDYWHDQQGRLAEPMVLREGAEHYEPIGWEEAFRMIGEVLKALPSPDDGIFYTSGRASNEAAFLYQLFVRHFGTNNLPDCSNMCHESSGAALNAAIGIGKGTVTLEDFYEADVIICAGQNPGTNHPRMLAALETAVKNGAEIVAVNPLKEAGLLAFAHPQKISGMLGKTTPLASQYLQVRINGDMALFRGVAKSLLEKGAVDEDFIAEHTSGLDEYRSLVEATEWKDIEEMSGIGRSEIERLAAKVAAGKRKLITCWAMGLTQHHNAVDTISEVSNVHLLVGAVGRPGAGLCPVRGHSNVQGDRTMGIFEKMPPAFHDRLDEVFQFQSPREHGYDVVQSILAMHREPGKVLLALGGNFAQATPDTDFTGEALRRCALTVHISTKLNRSHLVPGREALILPCLGRSEYDLQDGFPQFVTCENSMGIVQKSEGRLEPASENLKSEVAIIAGIAEATIGNSATVDWNVLSSDYDRIRELIEKTIPGFEDFNARARMEGGFYLPNGAKKREWKTSTGKARSACHPLDMSRVVTQLSAVGARLACGLAHAPNVSAANNTSAYL
ncbi:MAG: FdhF/YdeP family oxidoreductase [Verrucomicrobiota bacterium]